jgi:hypothetical protein
MQFRDIVRVLSDVDQIVIEGKCRRHCRTVAEWQLTVMPADRIGLLNYYSCVDWRSDQKPLP